MYLSINRIKIKGNWPPPHPYGFRKVCVFLTEMLGLDHPPFKTYDTCLNFSWELTTAFMLNDLSFDFKRFKIKSTTLEKKRTSQKNVTLIVVKYDYSFYYYYYQYDNIHSFLEISDKHYERFIKPYWYTYLKVYILFHLGF